MADKKLSPRQRMIGMMYLVLTALLALQVSSAVILKFQALNERIESSVHQFDAENKATIEQIVSSVEIRGNQPEEVKLKEKAVNIRRETTNMLLYIEDLKKLLVEKTGGIDEDGNPKRPREESGVEEVMIGANKTGKGYELKKKLNDYIILLNKETGFNFHHLALDGKEDPFFKNDEDQRKKDFANLHFGQTPLAAALATLSEIESEITKNESKVLSSFAQQVGIEQTKVDRLFPIVKTTNNVIAAGLDYEAQLMFGATSKTIGQKAEFEGEPIDVDGNGISNIKFKASGGDYGPDGRITKTWTGKIHAKTPDGKDTTYTITQEYTVVRPAIQFNSASVQSLYYNCANKLNIQVPALGTAYSPSITATGGILKQGSGAGNVTIVPKRENVKISVSNNGTFIGSQEFGVQPVPLPKVKATVGGKDGNNVQGVHISSIRNVKVHVIPDPHFKKTLPHETTYGITKWRVTLARRTTGVKEKVITNGHNANLSSFISEARDGDRLVIEIMEVKRKNSRGEYENVPVKEVIQVSLHD